MKTLFFEGAGCVPCGEVENCRIRTAFHNNKGDPIYVEIIGFEVREKKGSVSYVGWIDACFYIRDDGENENIKTKRNIEYTKNGILSLVNSLGCSFDKVVVLPDLAGYRVFSGDGGYNFGDRFVYNEELAMRAEEIERYIYELEKSEGKKYPNFSLWVDENDPELLHLLRHFPGLNRYWEIKNTENWQENIKEVKS
jgi:hypothetical protein